MININLKIKEFLTEKGIMEKTVANKTGMSKQNLNVLLDNSDMKFSQYFKLCEALEVDYLYFLANKETIKPFYNDTPDTIGNQSNQQTKKNTYGDITANGSNFSLENTVGEQTTSYQSNFDVAALLKELEDLRNENKDLKAVIKYLEKKK